MDGIPNLRIQGSRDRGQRWSAADTPTISHRSVWGRQPSRAGSVPKIIVDIGASVHWTVAESIARTLAFEEHDLYRIEEPLGADNPEGYAELTAATDTLIAYGEREWTVRGIERIVATKTVDVVGIDPGRVEGVTGSIRAAQLIDSAGRQANAHAFAGPISYAASLALSLASAACHELEVPPFLNQLYDVVGLPRRPANERVTAMSGAGLGFDIDEAAVRARCAR
ncbi:MAG TPA: enolase C-terminal domain-like protein [Dermatophilaceae bacterium]